jgi:methylase of polypeptide subunit release factors
MTQLRIDALSEVALALKGAGYRFTAVTPETVRRNNTRPVARSLTSENRVDRLRDVFGWNRSFRHDEIDERVALSLERAGAMHADGDALRSLVRFATLGDDLFMHSAYPTVEEDSVFFGPDSYRFASFLARELGDDPLPPGSRVVDIGCGSGVGAIVAARMLDDPTLVLSDFSSLALRFAAVNADVAGVRVAEFCKSDVLSGVRGHFDLIISNPPYMIDPGARLYRDGGGDRGSELSLRILQQSIQGLADGGRLLLYTGSAIVGGEDRFLARARDLLRNAGFRFRYEEIDPDVFGESLDEPAYAEVERIAAVGLSVSAP